MSSAPPSRVEQATAPTSTFEVEIVDEDDWQWRCIPADEIGSIVSVIAKTVAKSTGLPASQVAATLLLSNDAQVRALNRQWRDKDKPTNILSFPSGEEEAESPDAPLFLGDIVIAEETLVAEAREADIPVAHHFHHLVVHGLLHLLGFDHETEAEAEEMEALETSILSQLSVPDPYADTELLREGDGSKPSDPR